jgi:hypothetical protein
MDNVIDYKAEDSKENTGLGNKLAPKRPTGNTKGQMEDIKE